LEVAEVVVQDLLLVMTEAIPASVIFHFLRLHVVVVVDAAMDQHCQVVLAEAVVVLVDLRVRPQVLVRADKATTVDHQEQMPRHIAAQAVAVRRLLEKTEMPVQVLAVLGMHSATETHLLVAEAAEQRQAEVLRLVVQEEVATAAAAPQLLEAMVAHTALAETLLVLAAVAVVVDVLVAVLEHQPEALEQSALS
jgi:hypothetical protein